MSSVAGTGRYLYAISRGLDAADLATTTGLRGAPLEVVSHRGLDAVVSDVPLEEFDEAGLKQNLERLSWLEDVARGHDAVVHAVAAVGLPVAPLRLATICHADDGVRDRLDEWHDDLAEVLDRVAGRAEWSVKVIVPPVESQSAASTPVASGADYLRRKKADQEARESRLAVSTDLGENVHRSLTPAVVASRLLPPQDPQLSGHVGTMVLNAAYLVENGDADLFERRVAELAKAHPDVRIDSAGPWPPYSFAVLEQA
jgi:hypothetical protein